MRQQNLYSLDYLNIVSIENWQLLINSCLSVGHDMDQFHLFQLFNISLQNVHIYRLAANTRELFVQMAFVLINISICPLGDNYI